MEAEEAKAKLEMESNTIPDRLATKLNVDYDLIGPIEADRGDPYALQVISFKYIRPLIYGLYNIREVWPLVYETMNKFYICSALKNTDSELRIS